MELDSGGREPRADSASERHSNRESRPPVRFSPDAKRRTSCSQTPSKQAQHAQQPRKKDGKAKQDKFHCPANHEQNCLQLEPPHGPVSIPAAALFCSRLSESSPSSSSPPQPVGAAPASSSRNAQPRVSLLLPTLHEICAAQWPTLVYVPADVRDNWSAFFLRKQSGHLLVGLRPKR